MSIATQFRWKRAINSLRFFHEEYDLVKDVAKSAGPEFQKYYEKFCAEHDIDIAELNAKHIDRVKEAYGVKDEEDLGRVQDPVDRCLHVPGSTCNKGQSNYPSLNRLTFLSSFIR